MSATATGTYDAAMNLISSDGKTRVLVQYPLEVGKQWRMSGPSHAIVNWNSDEEVIGRVLAAETIRVPAGTFECMRVETEVNLGVKSYSQQRIHTRWYCPQIKWIAKEKIETRVYDPSRGYTRTFTESVLISFKRGD